MRPQARSLMQMPNKKGIRSMIALGLRRFSDGAELDVRYYSISWSSSLLRLFEHTKGKSEWYVDCFFCVNVHARDRDLIPYSKKWIVDFAEVFLWASKKYPFIARFSDSVFVSSTKI
jgi:hypothetical protein